MRYTIFYLPFLFPIEPSVPPRSPLSLHLKSAKKVIDAYDSPCFWLLVLEVMAKTSSFSYLFLVHIEGLEALGEVFITLSFLGLLSSFGLVLVVL